MCNFRVRAKLRDAAPGYDITSSYFIRVLYEDEKGDPVSPLTGFLKGPLLVRVSTPLLSRYCLGTQGSRLIATSSHPPLRPPRRTFQSQNLSEEMLQQALG